MSKSTSWTFVVQFIVRHDDENASVDKWVAICVENMTSCSGDSLDRLFEIIEGYHVTKVYFHDDDFSFSYIYNYLINRGCKYNPAMDDGVSYTEGSYKQFIIKGTTYYLKYKYIINDKYPKTCTFLSSKKLVRNKISAVADLYGISPVVDRTLQYCYKHKINEYDEQVTYNSAYSIAQFLHDIKKKISMTEITIGSNAIKSWKKLDNTYKLFGDIPLDIERDLYKAYRGGYNWINKDYVEKEIGEGVVLDINSLFPFTMKSFDCPVGLPRKSNKCPDHYFFVAHIIVGGDEINPGLVIKNKKLPCISSLSCGSIKNKYENRIYAKELWVTGFDLCLIFNNYIVDDMNIVEYYVLDHMSGIFNNFVDYWYDLKKKSDGPIREVAKLFLDNIHGKLGTRIERLVNGKYIHQKNQIPCKIGNKIKLEDLNDTENKGIRYLPASIFINSISRFYIIVIAQQYYDRLIYIDTDSLHLVGLDDVLNVTTDEKYKLEIGNDLGQFKIESIFKRAKYIGLKTYIHDDYIDFDKFDSNFNHGNDTILNVTMAGASDIVTSKITFENFKTGTYIPYCKTMIKNLNGGKVRYLTTYKITQCAEKD